MRKSIFLFGLLAATFTSCSEDETTPILDNPGTNATLVKKIIYDDSDDFFDGTVTYTYDGTKLLEGNYNDGTKEKYYYEGNAIVKIEYFSDTNQLDYQDLFTYDSAGKLVAYRAQDFIDDSEEKSLFTYNADNTITETQINGAINNSITTGSQSKLYLAGEEIVKIEQLFAFGATYNYSYDAKNSPFKNVTGYGAIALASAGDFELFGRNQNITAIFDDTNDSEYMTNTNVYNAADYPVSVSSEAIFDADFPTSITTLDVQYIYE